MSVKYHINVDKKLSRKLWELLTENFNCIVSKIQHDENGEKSRIYIVVENISNDLD